MFTDLVGFSAWALRAGDAVALELLREVGIAVEEPILDQRGRIVKRLGDGVMATFLDARNAVDAALDAQAAVDRIEIEGWHPRMRAGLHWGSPRRRSTRSGCRPAAQSRGAASAPERLQLLLHTADRPDVGSMVVLPWPPPPTAGQAVLKRPRRPFVRRPMTSPRRPHRRPAAALATMSLVGLAVLSLSSPSPAARAADTSQLQQRITAGKQRASALFGAAHAAGQRVDSLGVGISRLAGQISTIQVDLDAKRAQLLALQTARQRALMKLAHLQAVARHAQAVLSEQMVGSYEADRPDLVSVVLESTGFSNLLERLSFAQRISAHDAQIVGKVRASRRAVAIQATQLGKLALRQQTLTEQALYERNRIARARVVLVTQQLAAIKIRDAKNGQLSSVDGQVGSLQQQLGRLQAAERASAARASAARASAARASASAGPQSGSSRAGGLSGSPGTSSAPLQASSGGGGGGGGGFTFPLPKSAASPPGTWSLDDGVDISAPGGTPEYAVCSGTIVLHGIGGFGPSAPVLHCDSTIDGYGYVYYGHAGPGNWTAVGTHVSAGQTISEVGSGIVGISSGPHVEMGFADSSGAPIGPSSASQMMSLLQAAYGG